MAAEVVRRDDPGRPVALSIIIPTYNRASVLMEALEAFREQTYEPYELIVVDNGPSTDDTRARVLAHQAVEPRLIYVSTTDQGDFVARNIGCRMARADLLLTTDDDWEMTDPETLAYVAEAFASDAGLGVLGIGEDYEDRYGLTAEQRKGWRWRIRTAVVHAVSRPGRIHRWGRLNTRFHYLAPGRTHRLDHVRSCCMAFRRAPAEAAGFFPTLYVQGGQGYRGETELCRRVAEAGYGVALSMEVVGVHKTPKRPAGTMARGRKALGAMRYQARNNTLFFLRNYWSPPTAPVFFVWDWLVGNYRQPGLLRAFFSRRYLGRLSLVRASLGGKWQGFREYRKGGARPEPQTQGSAARVAVDRR